MPSHIEDYALIGNCHTAGLVGRDGSIDWLCFPRFDSPACFAALLGGPEHGRWKIAPCAAARRTMRRYRNGTLILETEMETDDGAIRLIDFMSLSAGRSDVVRIVEGLRGTVAMRMELIIRCDYGSIVPWVRRMNHALLAMAGPDALELHASVPTEGKHLTTVANFLVAEGERAVFTLNHRPSHEASHVPLDALNALDEVEHRWRAWSAQCRYQGPWRQAVMQSLITLKALSYQPTGGIVAAPTTSLPEQRHGSRNWDYRYCWLRDATFTLNALLLSGYRDEATAWEAWLLRAIAGSPNAIQTVYSVTGERRLSETVLDWLPGYEGAVPVRIGNAASDQLQLDVWGELMDTFHMGRLSGLNFHPHAWQLQIALLKFLEANWHLPDNGIWEIRGPQQHFVHSKIMAWVAFDRAIKAVEQFGLDGPVVRWRRVRETIHAQVCAKGFDPRRNTFVQTYGSPHLDASLLLIPQLGFLPPDDPRVRGTIDAIQRGLVVDRLVLRYSTDTGIDALPPGEGTFLCCSFWLADALALSGRHEAATALFEYLVSLSNDVGLLAEEYDPADGRMWGNFPQALSHMALINTAHLLSASTSHAKRVCMRGERPATATRAPAFPPSVARQATKHGDVAES